MNFLFACGGSGGHIFPALAVAQELERRQPGSRVYFACGNRDIESEIFRVVPKDAVFPVSGAPFRGARSIVDPRFLLKLLQGYFQSRALLQKLKPAVVVGFGGYVSFPVLMAAKRLGIKNALHEQNVAPGRANRVLSGFVDAVALSFEESLPVFRKARRKKVTGNPIRASIEKDCREEALNFFGFSPEKHTLLVLGGSQGAESINRLFLESLPFWDDDMKREWQALHLCGIMLPAQAEASARSGGIFSRAFSFFGRMDLAYSAADVCLGRAGATFLAEIDAKGLPAMLVPYPHGDGHQRQNARVFAAHRVARVAEQSQLTPEKVARTLRELMQEAQKIPVRRTASGARAALADFVEELSA